MRHLLSQSAAVAAALLCVTATLSAHGQTPVALPKSSTPTSAPPPPFECSLAQCVALGQRRSPFTEAARSDLSRYRSLLSEAQAARYPRFEVTGFFAPLPEKRAGRSGQDLLNDWDWTSLSPLATTQLSFTQVLWTFGKIDALIDASKAGIDVGRAAVHVAQMEVGFQVARAWWGLVLARELTAIIADGSRAVVTERERLERLRRQAEDEDKDFDDTQLLRLRLAEADLQARVLQAKRGAALAEDSLRIALGLPSGTHVTTTAKRLEPLQVELLPMAAYERLAVENHPRLLALRSGAVARFAQLRYEKRRLYPDFVLTGRLAYTYAPTVGASGDSLADNPTNPTQSGAGIGLRWRLDVFRQLARVSRAQSVATKARALARGEAQKIRITVRDLYRQTRDAKALVNVHYRALTAARGWMRSEGQLAKGGFTPYRELVRAMEAYYRRKVAWLEAIYRFNTNVAALSRAVGLDVATLPRRPAQRRGE